jgi:hypothetical protein
MNEHGRLGFGPQRNVKLSARRGRRSGEKRVNARSFSDDRIYNSTEMDQDQPLVIDHTPVSARREPACDRPGRDPDWGHRWYATP